MRCGAQHPEDATRACIDMPGGHGSHQDAQGAWPNVEALEQAAQARSHRPSKKGSRRRMLDLAGKAAAGRTQFLRNERKDQSVTLGAPVEALEKWSKEAWRSYAEGVLRSFLLHRSTPFTTAEHLWPLLEKPEEMRALSPLVQAALRAGLMVEVDSVRLKGVYVTKDGHQFAENKLVPIYQSTTVPEGWAD